jgi:hypothetical protein
MSTSVEVARQKVVMKILARFAAAAITLSTATLLCPVSTEAVPVQWSSGLGGNDHWYEYVGPQGVASWTQAKADAEAMIYLGSAGYLATVTSAEERNFVVALFSGSLSSGSGPWLGGFQPPNQSSPSAGWQWVTGEPWSYTDFRLGSFGCFGPEPNDSDCGTPVEDNEENYLHMSNITGAWLWNDAPDAVATPGFIVEFNPSPTQAPEPASAALLGMGLAVGIHFLRRRR